MNWLVNKIKRAYKYYKRYGIWKLTHDKILDRIVAKYWKTKPVWTPRKIFIDKKNLKIEKPIFLLGVQGGGLTLIHRIIRRHPQIVYISGNSKYWAGSDEMDKVVKKIPNKLALRSPGYKNLTGNENKHSIFGVERSWLYASNEFLKHYRMTEEDYFPQIKKQFREIIKNSILAYASNVKKSRFTDMSQSFSIKVPLINKLLEDTRPQYIVVLRNPYAMCWRELTRNPKGNSFWKSCPTKRKRIKLFAEHWCNSYKLALKDLEVLDSKSDYEMYKIIRFEDVLNNCKDTMQEVFDFLGLKFSVDFMPQKYHKLPLGSADRSKWYPLQLDINKKYLDEIPEWAIVMIREECGEIADKFNYTPDGP